MKPTRMLLFFAALHTAPTPIPKGEQGQGSLDGLLEHTSELSTVVLQANILDEISTGDLSQGACSVALQAIPQVAQYLWAPEGSNPQKEEENESFMKKAVKYSTQTYCSLSQTLLFRLALSFYKATKAANCVVKKWPPYYKKR